MQGKFAVIIHDCVAGIAAALKTNDNIRVLGQNIRKLSLTFIAPVGTDDCFYHNRYLSTFILRKREEIAPKKGRENAAKPGIESRHSDYRFDFTIFL